MNIKELLKIEVPFPTNAIKKPFIWLCSLKKYISFNLISFIGWLDVCLILFFVLNGGIGDNTGVPGIAAVFICMVYFAITRTATLIFLLLFVVEKLTKYKIKNNFIDINKTVYNILFCFSLIVNILVNLFIIYVLIGEYLMEQSALQLRQELINDGII